MTRTSLHCLGLGLISVALFSCAPAPKIKHPELDIAIPSERMVPDSTQRPDEIKADWWTDFGDTRLDTLVLAAFQRNYSLQAAAAAVEAAAAQAKIAGAPLWPQLNLSLDANRRRQNFIGFPIPGAPEGGVLSTTISTYGASLNTSWEIDLWGRLRADKAAALAEVQATLADHHAAQLSLAAQTAKIWFAAIEAGWQAELARATVENFQISYDRVKARYDRGIGSSLDVRLALSNLSSAQDVHFQRQNQLENAIRQLEILLGEYPAATHAVATTLPALPDFVPAGIPAELVTRRPDLIAAERRLAAAGARVSQARAALFPRLSLTASGGTSSDEIKSLLDGDFLVWNVIGNLLQPLFQGGRLRANVSLSQARQEQALALYAQSVLEAFREIESMLAAERYLAEREGALAVATQQAVAARDLAQDRYERGLIGIITLLESQRRAFNSESQLLSVQRQRLDTRIDFYVALGGGINRDFEQ